jgi:hypothetical protein
LTKYILFARLFDMFNIKEKTLHRVGLLTQGTLSVFAGCCKAALPAVKIGGIFPLSGSAAVLEIVKKDGRLAAVYRATVDPR